MPQYPKRIHLIFDARDGVVRLPMDIEGRKWTLKSTGANFEESERDPRKIIPRCMRGCSSGEMAADRGRKYVITLSSVT